MNCVRCKVHPALEKWHISTENVSAFFEKVADDKGLQEKLKAIDVGVHEGQKALDGARGKAVQVAADAGYDFTAAELSQRLQSGEKELREGELKAVAGGWEDQTPGWSCSMGAIPPDPRFGRGGRGGCSQLFWPG